MLKKTEIEELREKYILGTRGAPAEITDKHDRRKFRITAIYVLGLVLEMPEEEDSEDGKRCNIK